MTDNYLSILAETIRTNWDQHALTDFYLTEDGTAQDTSRGNHYTYGEMYQEILHVCDIFQSLDLQEGDHIAICGANSAHWAIAYLAIATYQGVAVTILHSQSPEDIAHQIDFSDAKALFTDSDLWKELKDFSLQQVEHVIGLEDWKIFRGKEIQIINHKLAIINRDCHFSTGDIDTLAMICFTSGTTGASRGVMLSYRNISYTIAYQVEEYLGHFARTNTISLLPLGHLYGCIDEFVRNMYLGTHVNILKNAFSVDLIVQSYRIIQPSYVALVPFLLKHFMEAPLNPHSVTDFFGDKIEKVFVAGAELSKDTEIKLMSIQFPLLKGYGATECSPSIANSITCEQKIGSVGKPVSRTMIKIAFNGEILVKGENVMLGYYKDPEATAAKIDSDGWLHTGDKGHLDEDGYLYVEGRLEQDIIVLPNGENIRPDHIESLINALPEVSESIVLARDGKLVAIVVPQITNHQSPITNTDLRRKILRAVNPSLPLFSQLYDVEITDVPLQRTEKQTIKRYLYK